MTIIRATSQTKNFEGKNYLQYSLFVKDGAKRVLITATGRVPVCMVDADGTLLADQSRLDQVPLKSGDQIEIWYTNDGKIAQIDLIMPSEVIS